MICSFMMLVGYDGFVTHYDVLAAARAPCCNHIILLLLLLLLLLLSGSQGSLRAV
jgi:hypothetical protein